MRIYAIDIITTLAATAIIDITLTLRHYATLLMPAMLMPLRH
jgi:hypothetical protein